MTGQLWGYRNQWLYIAICDYDIKEAEKDGDHWAEAHIRFGWTKWLDRMWKHRGLSFEFWAILQGDTDITEGFNPQKVVFRDGKVFGIKVPDLLEWPYDEVHVCEMDLTGRSVKQ